MRRLRYPLLVALVVAAYFAFSPRSGQFWSARHVLYSVRLPVGVVLAVLWLGRFVVLPLLRD
jgi:hypothetical protein